MHMLCAGRVVISLCASHELVYNDQLSTQNEWLGNASHDSVAPQLDEETDSQTVTT